MGSPVPNKTPRELTDADALDVLRDLATKVKADFDELGRPYTPALRSILTYLVKKGALAKGVLLPYAE